MTANIDDQKSVCRHSFRADLLVTLAVIVLLGSAVSCTGAPSPAVSSTAAVTPIYLTAADAAVGATGTATPFSRVQPAPVAAQDDIVRITTAALADGQARFYVLQAEGVAIPFFVLMSSDGKFRAALDACDACYPAKRGFHQEGDELVCNNCGSRFPSNEVNVESGGCNPISLPFTQQDDILIIRAADLAAGARYF